MKRRPAIPSKKSAVIIWFFPQIIRTATQNIRTRSKVFSSFRCPTKTNEKFFGTTAHDSTAPPILWAEAKRLVPNQLNNCRHKEERNGDTDRDPIPVESGWRKCHGAFHSQNARTFCSRTRSRQALERAQADSGGIARGSRNHRRFETLAGLRAGQRPRGKFAILRRSRLWLCDQRTDEGRGTARSSRTYP